MDVPPRPPVEIHDDAPRIRRRRRTPVYRQPWFVSLVTAVVILGTIVLNRPPGPPTWGWNRPGLLNRGDTGAEHLRALADAADEWQARPKRTAAELRRSLKEMRDGCTALLDAGHRQLAPEDRAWLADQCVTWGTRLDRLLADLQHGRPVDDVRREADETVEAIGQALRKRSED
jgi:hypothetical protein